MLKAVFKYVIVSVLTIEARLVLEKYKPKIIAVTGNIGKTSTKDAVHTVMASRFRARKSQKSFNSEVGVPLTILGLPNAWNNPLKWIQNIIAGCMLLISPNTYPEWLVLEVGADRPGDIKRLASWLKPDVVVLTYYPEVPVHVEAFASPAEVIKEKQYLARALKPDGVLVVNTDSELIMQQKMPNVRILTYGFAKNADISASSLRFTYSKDVLLGTYFRVQYKEEDLPITLHGVLGHQHAYPVLAAFAVGISQKMSIVAVDQAFHEHDFAPGRMRILEGIHESTIIDDTYNSSPTAVKSALEALGKVKTDGKKVAVLGDMMELGSYSADAHKEVGKEVALVADILVTVGIRSMATAEAAHKAKMKKKTIYPCDDADMASELVVGLVEQGDVILVKGSQSMRMEKVVEELLAQPKEKEKLLVRQDKEWKHR